MFGGLIDDFKVSLQLTLRAMIAGVIFAAAGVAAFACGLVILFLWTLETYGALYAWGAIAGVFGGLALAALIPLLSTRSRRRTLARAAERRAAEAEAGRSRNPEWWQDPAMLLTGVQVVRAVGLRRLLPLLAVGAVVAGVALARQPAQDDDTTLQAAE